MGNDRKNNYLPELSRGHISGIPKKLSEISIYCANPAEEVDVKIKENVVIIPITKNYKTIGLMS